MNQDFEANGGCLCGAVSFTARHARSSIGACHCDMCRQWSGGPFMGVHCGSEVIFRGQECISIYASSAWAERGFCKRCGSHLFYRLKQSLLYFIPVGLFAEQDRFTLDRQSYIDCKPAYYEFANATQDMTRAEMLDKYGES